MYKKSGLGLVYGSTNCIAVDVSWPQGDYKPAAGLSFVGVGATSLDGGKPFVQSTYVEDVNNIHADNLPAIHYAFNGNTATTSPAAFAQYMVSNLHDYKAGVDAIALDVEPSTGFRSWNPSEVTQFYNELKSLLGYTTLIIYGDRSDMATAGYGALEKAGCLLWLAVPGGTYSTPTVGEWSAWTILQNSTAGNIDHDISVKTIAEILGGTDVPLSEADLVSIHNDTVGILRAAEFQLGQSTLGELILLRSQLGLRQEFTPNSEVSNRVVSLLNTAVAPLEAQITALTAAVQALSTGIGVDPTQVLAAVQTGVDQAVKELLANAVDPTPAPVDPDSTSDSTSASESSSESIASESFQSETAS